LGWGCEDGLLLVWVKMACWFGFCRFVDITERETSDMTGGWIVKGLSLDQAAGLLRLERGMPVGCTVALDWLDFWHGNTILKLDILD